MQRPKETCTGARPRGKISFVSPIILCVIILLVLALLFLGYQYRSLIFPKPLTLSSGQDIKTRFVIDAAGPYHVGDLLPVNFEVEARNGVTFQMPDLMFTNQQKVDLKHKGEVIKEKRRGGYAESVRYLLTSWDVGEYNIPANSISYKTSGGGAGTYQVPNLKFDIVSLLPKDKSTEALLALPLKPARKPFGLPPNYKYLWWFFIGLIVIGLIFAVFKLLSKVWPKKVSQAVTEPLVVEPAHIIAFRRLEALLSENFPERGEFKLYYSELSECIREYMENRFQIRALEMTTEEFLDRLTRDECLKAEHRVILEDFLRSSDFVKFAKHIPSVSETDADFGKARQLVEETKEIPAASEEIEQSVISGENQ